MEKNIQAFVADIDGTLVAKGEKLLDRTRNALERLHQEGVLVGIATGRPLDQRILDKAKEWNLSFEFDFAIGMNGGDLWDKENRVIEHYYPLSSENICSILSFLKDFDSNAIVYEKGYDQVACLRMDDFMKDSIRRNHSHVEVGDIQRLSKQETGKIEVHCKGDELEAVYAAIEKNRSDAWISVETFRAPEHFTIEFQDPRVNKGMGLERFAQQSNIPLEKIIAFGDMENDIPLLEKAGWGVAMQNGSKETKERADAITEHSVEEDGIGRYLEAHYWM